MLAADSNTVLTWASTENLLATPPVGLYLGYHLNKWRRSLRVWAYARESMSHADTRSIELVRLSDAGATDDSRLLADDSLDHDTSPSLVPHSKYGSSFIYRWKFAKYHPTFWRAEHEKFDMVEVLSQTRKDGRIYRAVGTVKRVDPARPHYVRLYGHKKSYGYRRVLQNFTRQWTLMISNDTQSSKKTHFAVLLMIFVVLLWRRLKFYLT